MPQGLKKSHSKQATRTSAQIDPAAKKTARSTKASDRIAPAPVNTRTGGAQKRGAGRKSRGGRR